MDELTDTLGAKLSEKAITRDDLQGEFEKSIGELRTKRLDGLDEEQQAVVGARFMLADRRAASVLRDAYRIDQKHESAARVQSTLENYQRLAVSDPGSAIEQANVLLEQRGPGLFGAEKVGEMKQRFAESAFAQHFERRMVLDGRNPDALSALEADISGNDVLDPGKKTEMLARLGTAKMQASAGFASDLEISVRRGRASYAQIEEAFKAGRITGPKRTDLTVWLDGERKRALKEAEGQRQALGSVQNALDGAGFLDFRSDKDRKAVDLYFDRVLSPTLGRAKLDPGQLMVAVSDYVANTGIIPGQIRQQIRGSLRAGDAASKVTAADFLDRLKSASPQVLNDFAEEDIRLANTIATHVRAGVTPLRAVELAEASLNVPEPEREARKTRYTHEKAPEKNLKRLDKDLSGFRLFSQSLPDKVPDALRGEFETLVREEFVRSGNLEAAQSTALDDMKRVWGVTRTGGRPAWMKYAPETVYGVPGDDGSWIRRQLISEATQGSMFDGKPDLVLAADSLTAREQRPSYVVLNRRNGVLEPVWGRDGKPMRFRPDYPGSVDAKARQEALDKEQKAGQKILDGVRTGRIKQLPAALDDQASMIEP